MFHSALLTVNSVDLEVAHDGLLKSVDLVVGHDGFRILSVFFIALITEVLFKHFLICTAM